MSNNDLRQWRAEAAPPLLRAFSSPQKTDPSDVFVIGANCIFQAGGRFFAIIEIEAPTSAVPFEPDTVFELSFAQASALLAAGVAMCTVQTTIPVPGPGVTQTLKGVFTIGNQGFIVFDQEDTFDQSVLVVTPVIPVVPLT